MGESASPFERTIQTSIGNAVIDKAAPKNKTCCPREAAGENQSGTCWVEIAKGTANRNGTTTPAEATATVSAPRSRTLARSKSSPTQKIYPPTPSAPTTFNQSSVATGNTHDCSAGQNAPSIEGPSNTPATIMPTTEGCPSLVASLPARKHTPIMTPACKQSERMSGSGLIEALYSEVGEGAERTRPGQARPCVGRLTKWNYFFAEAFTAPGE